MRVVLPTKLKCEDDCVDAAIIEPGGETIRCVVAEKKDQSPRWELFYNGFQSFR